MIIRTPSYNCLVAEPEISTSLIPEPSLWRNAEIISSTSDPDSLRYISLLSFHLLLYLPSGRFSSGFSMYGVSKSSCGHPTRAGLPSW
jgi:hypothetical protein